MPIKITPNDLASNYRKSRPDYLDLTEITETLRPFVIKLVEKAFKTYAAKHKGITKELIDKEWLRLEKELRKVL